MTLIESLERANVGAIRESAQQWRHKRTKAKEIARDLIEPDTVTAIENKADLLLRGPGVRHGVISSGIYRKISQGTSIEVIRQIDTAPEGTRYYSIYYTSPEGTHFAYRSVRKSDDSSHVTINSSNGELRDGRQSEGLVLLQVLRQVDKKKDLKREMATALKRAALVFQR